MVEKKNTQLRAASPHSNMERRHTVVVHGLRVATMLQKQCAQLCAPYPNREVQRTLTLKIFGVRITPRAQE